MSNYTNIRELLREFNGQDNVFTIPRIYVKFAGDLSTAILLNQIVYYSDKSKRSDGFFYKSYADWEHEICLTERQVRYAANKLKKAGLIETKLAKVDGAPTVHYRLDYDKLLDSILTFCEDANGNFVRNVPDDLSVSSYTKNTTKNTNKESKILFDDTSEEMILTNHLVEQIRKNNATFKTPKIQSWCKDFNKMLRIDKRDKYEIYNLITQVHQDEFWFKNILSPAALRKNYDKLIMQLIVKAPKVKTPAPKQKGPVQLDFNEGEEDE